MQVAIWTLCIFVQHTSSMCGWFFAGIRGSPIGTSSLWRDASTSLVARLSGHYRWGRWCLRSVHDSSPIFFGRVFHGNQVTHTQKASLRYRRCHNFQLSNLPCCPFDTESGIAVQLVPIHLQLGQAGYPNQRGHQDDGTRWWFDVPWPVRKGWFLLLGKLETTRNAHFSCNSAKYRSPCARNLIQKPWDMVDIQMLPRQKRKIIKHHWFWFPLMR